MILLDLVQMKGEDVQERQLERSFGELNLGCVGRYAIVLRWKTRL